MRLINIVSIFSLFMFFGCSASKEAGSSKILKNMSSNRLIMDQGLDVSAGENDPQAQENPVNNEPGRCYAKANHNDVYKWVDVICDNQLTELTFAELKLRLFKLGYEINLEEEKVGYWEPSTKAAYIQFQKDNDLAFGQLDWASMNILRLKAEAVNVESIIDGKN